MKNRLIIIVMFYSRIYVLAILISTFLSLTSLAQNVHTVYLDNKRKAVFSQDFASYVLKYSDYSENTDLRRYRVNYSSGEVYADGFYNTIDTLDFDSSNLSNSTFYYKDGQTMKEILEIDSKNKVVTKFHSNGMLASIDSLCLNKLEGSSLVFDKENKTCEIHKYHEGLPTLPFYIVKDLVRNTESAFYNGTKTPYFFSVPSKSYQVVRVEKLGKWEIYDNNYMLLAMQWQKLNDHGKYHQIWIAITNCSTLPIEFDPNDIKAIVNRDNRSGSMTELYQLDKKEYKDAITKPGFWEYFGMGLAGLAVGFANYQDTKYYSNAGFSAGFINNSYYQNFDVTSSIIGQQIISNRIANRNIRFHNMLAANSDSRQLEAQVKTINYLSKTTINPGEQIVGYINFKYEKGVNLILRANINNIDYDFDFDIMNNRTFKSGKYKIFDALCRSSNCITVRGLQEDDVVEILDSNENLIDKKVADGNVMNIRIREPGAYVVRVGNKKKFVRVQNFD